MVEVGGGGAVGEYGCGGAVVKYGDDGMIIGRVGERGIYGGDEVIGFMEGE